MSASYKTPAYFSDFSCLGADCEDTCCRDWEVKVDHKHFDMLKQAMCDNEVLFSKNVYLNTSEVSGDYDYAYVRMNDTGYCSMLQDNALCLIHEKYGEDSLGDVCTMFPRVISRYHDRFELCGSLSCPEVVTRCIEADNPLKLDAFKPADLPRKKDYPVQRESVSPQDYYEANFEFVRKNIMQLMLEEELELETRLYVLANYAQLITEFYYRGCPEPDDKLLSVTTAAISDKNVQERFDELISNYQTELPVSMIVVHSVMSIKLEQAADENISQLYSNILQYYDTVKADELAQILVTVRTKTSSRIRTYIDRAVTRYILNCMYREWFIAMPDLFTYVQMLLVRMAMLRTLVYLDMGTEDSIDEESMKKRIVYIMYNFARNVEQNHEFLKLIYTALSEQSMMNFDFSPEFIRIY